MYGPKNKIKRKDSNFTLAFMCVHKITKSDYKLRHVCPPVCLYGITHWTGFHLILDYNILKKICRNFQVSLQCDKNNETGDVRMM